MPGIVTLTLNPAVDASCDVPQVMPERKLRCGPPEFHPGGGGINVARAVAELGGEATAYWMCGGAVGDLLRTLLDEESVRHEPIPIREMTRENVIVYEESSGQQFRFCLPGASLSENEIDACVERLQSISPPPDYVVLSGSLPPGVDHGLYARVARAVGGPSRVVLDTSGPALREGLQAPLFLIKPNMHELAQLAGRDIEDDAQIRGVAQELIDSGAVQVVVTSLGSGGLAVTTADSHELVRAPTVKIRSKVGAGDSTVAGIVLALARGESVADAARFGVAAGAAAVMTEGTELCRRADAERLYAELREFAGGG